MTVVTEERIGAPPYEAYATILGVFVGGLGIAEDVITTLLALGPRRARRADAGRKR